MSKALELPDQIYEGLERISRERGLTVEDYIATIVSGHECTNADDDRRVRSRA